VGTESLRGSLPDQWSLEPLKLTGQRRNAAVKAEGLVLL